MWFSALAPNLFAPSAYMYGTTNLFLHSQMFIINSFTALIHIQIRISPWIRKYFTMWIKGPYGVSIHEKNHRSTMSCFKETVCPKTVKEHWFIARDYHIRVRCKFNHTVLWEISVSVQNSSTRLNLLLPLFLMLKGEEIF